MNIFFNSNRFHYWIIATAIIIILIFVPVFMEGMFLDGLVYASISRNLSENIGSFWNLSYTKTLGNHFYDQPALVFKIQSYFFGFFGDSIYVEKIYTLITFIITILLITVLWKRITKNSPLFKQFDWLPIILFTTIPLVFWSYSNNMLENTMSIFDLLSIIFLLKSSEKIQLLNTYFLLGTFFILLAFLSKGPVGLFPMAFYIIHWYSFREFKLSIAVLRTVFLILLLISFFLIIIFLFPDSKVSLLEFLEKQVINGLEGKRETAKSRLLILQKIILELLPMFILLIISTYIRKRNQAGFIIDSTTKKIFKFVILIAFSASLPILVSEKQSGYYLVPSFPFYTIAFSLLIMNVWGGNFLIKKSMFNKSFKFISYSLLVFSFILLYSQTGKIRRDEKLILLTNDIKTIINNETTISICSELEENWELHAYLYRYCRISLDSKKANKYLLTLKNCRPSYISDYRLIFSSNNYYEIYLHK